MSADVHMLSGAYAVDAIVDDVERRRFERHLDECEPCRREVRSLRAAAVALGEVVEAAPPPSLHARIRAQIATTSQLPAVEPRSPRASTPARLRPAWRAAVAAVAVLLAGGGMAIAGVELRHARQADDRAAQVLAIAGDPAAHRATGALARGGSVTVIVAGARAALVTTDMPGLADDRIYQLWLVRPGQVQSAGLGPGGGAAAGRWSRLITGVSAGDEVAISVEPSGGSRQPTTTPLALLSA